MDNASQRADLTPQLHAAADAASQAFRRIRSRPDLFAEVGIGADGAPTTRIDRELENAVLAALDSVGACGEVLSEEVGRCALRNPGPLLWVLDPLDGTSNAALGFPYFALSLGVLSGDEVLAGVVHNYSTGDRFIARRGGGACLNGTPIRVRPRDSKLESATLVLSRPFNDAELPAYARCIRSAKRVRMTGCPSLDVCSVASGAFSAYVDHHVPAGLVHTHDVIAAKCILEEAGGHLLNASGTRAVLRLDTTSTLNLFAVTDPSTFRMLANVFVA